MKQEQNEQFDTKIISVAHSKGGVGKSTLTILLARGMKELYNKKICILDCDYQGSVMSIYVRDISTGITKEQIGIDVMKVSPDKIIEVLGVVFGKYDYIFLDMPRITGETDQEILYYYYNTNFIVIPILVGTTDLDALSTFLAIADAIKKERNASEVEFEYYGIGNMNDGSADYSYLHGDAEQIGLPIFDNTVKKLHDIKKITFTSNIFTKKSGIVNLVPVIEEFNQKLKGG